MAPGRKILAAVLAALPAAGCGSCTPPPGGTCPDGSVVLAQDQMNAALAGATSCQTDDDCALVPTPCSLTTVCGFQFAAVAIASEEAVEHDFSVTGAETCGDCTPPSAGVVGASCPFPIASLLSPGVFCDAGSCTVVGLLPDAGPPGAFEWSCNDACDTSGALTGIASYCEVGQVTSICGGWAGTYIEVAEGGVCEAKSVNSPTCESDSDCGFGNACDTSTQTCRSRCPRSEPATCDGGCVLTSDNHACQVCWCPHGCPPAG